MSVVYWIAAGVVITTIIMALFQAWRGLKTWKDWNNGKESKNTAVNDQKTSTPKAPETE
ncbi:MAG TPA: hypothetical protein VFE98_09645 [Candidatus Bathyarchaeia archaeon]|nr:hypothetical protein [Candidatus Bathyarchaeia archaeon]